MSEELLNTAVRRLLSFTCGHNRERAAMLKATGERFNIFNVLRVRHLEVKTHSPMLGEVLDPQGSHDQGAVFLELFLKQFGVTPFAAAKATVELEYHAGEKTEKSGGRIDILIRDGEGEMIVIENKIYARDQEKQMARYKALSEKAHVFYLTLDGRKPSGATEEELGGVQCISYKVEVLAWLKECRKEAALLPGLRETLTQYIRLIEELTEQSTTSRMNEKLIEEIVRDEDSLRAFYTIREAGIAVEDAAIKKLDAQLDGIAASVGLERYARIGDLRKQWAGFSFTTPGLRRENLRIAFEFDESWLKEFYFGFALNDKKKACSRQGELAEAFYKHFEREETNE